jgi:hypothetical protein
MIERAHRPDVAHVLDGEANVAHRSATRQCGGFRLQAAALQRVLAEETMRLDLLAQVGVVPRPSEEAQQPSEHLHGIHLSARAEHGRRSEGVCARPINQ